MKINKIYVVVKNYGQNKAVFDKQTALMSFLLTESKNNLTKTLNQVIIKNSLQKTGMFYIRKEKLELSVEEVNINNE